MNLRLAFKFNHGLFGLRKVPETPAFTSDDARRVFSGVLDGAAENVPHLSENSADVSGKTRTEQLLRAKKFYIKEDVDAQKAALASNRFDRPSRVERFFSIFSGCGMR